jgi:hypothetical protein
MEAHHLSWHVVDLRRKINWRRQVETRAARRALSQLSRPSPPRKRGALGHTMERSLPPPGEINPESLRQGKMARCVRMSNTRFPLSASRSKKCATSRKKAPRSSCWTHVRSVPTGEVTCRYVGPSVSFPKGSRSRHVLSVCPTTHGSLPTVLDQMKRQAPVWRESFSGRDGLTRVPCWVAGMHGRMRGCRSSRETQRLVPANQRSHVKALIMADVVSGSFYLCDLFARQSGAGKIAHQEGNNTTAIRALHPSRVKMMRICRGRTQCPMHCALVETGSPGGRNDAHSHNN